MNAQTVILMIDLDESIVEPFTSQLEQRGYGVDCVADTGAAYTMLRKRSYAAAITRLHDDNNDGIDFIRSVSKRNNATPIIALVQHSQSQIALKALSSGAYDCVGMPVDDIEILIAVTARAAEKSRLLLENRQLAESVKAHSEGLAKVTRKLQRLATIDETTNLRNQKHFHEALAMEISRSQRHKRYFSIMLIKINEFDIYKFQHGAKASDLLLYSFAMLLRDKMRVSDTVARYDDDEFALLLPETSQTGALELCERLNESVAVYPFPGKESFAHNRITINIGISTFPDNGNTSNALIEHSLSSLYKR